MKGRPVADDSARKVKEVEIQPFLRLGKYLSAEFMSEVEELLFLVSHYGMSQTPEEPKNKEEFARFSAHVHDGWKQAQVRIASMLVDALARKAATEADEKEQHRRRDKAGQLEAKRAAHRVRVEIQVLRRMLDVALWTVLEGDHSTLRRLFVVDGNNSLSEKNIREGMAVATELNAKPHVIALCTDMLSMVHVGDLFVADRELGEVNFVELKSGDKNIAISKAAEFAAQSGCKAFEHWATQGLNGTDAKHFARAKKQATRNTAVIDTIKNEGGIDHNTGFRVDINPIPEPLECWADEIVACRGQLTETKKWALTTVDECVYVGVYSDPLFAFAGFKGWMGAMNCASPLYNLTDSFRMPWARPLGAMLLPIDLMKEILRGDILVIVCLDVQGMVDAVNARQPEFLELLSPRETAKQRQRMKGLEMLELNGRGVRARLGDVKMELGGGFRDRVVFDQCSPLQLMHNQMMKMTDLLRQQEAGAAPADGPGAPTEPA